MCAKPSRLEKERQEALFCAKSVRASFGNMISRCKAAGETPDPQLILDFDSAMAQCELQMQQETDSENFKELKYLAKTQGQLGAYLCPISQIYDEGAALLDLLKDWGFPDVGLARYRSVLDAKCRGPNANPQAARSGLHAIMHEVDACEDYLDSYQNEVWRLSKILLTGVIVFFLASLGLLFLSSRHSTLFPLALFMAGATGSCVSVLARMPISEVSSSAAVLSMEPKILIRVATGVIASVVGSSLLAWGAFPIQINNLSFSSVVAACVPSAAGGCSTVYSLILLAVPIMFGFTERILTTLESRLFGAASSRQ